MFEKFTEKAINVVSESQHQAAELHTGYVTTECLLLALIKEAKGISLKLFKMYNVDFDSVKRELVKTLSQCAVAGNPMPFSDNYKSILRTTMDLAGKSGNPTVLYEHLFLAVISEKNSNAVRILQELGFNIPKSKELLEKLVQKKIKKLYHPELEEQREAEPNPSEATDSLFEGEESSKIFERAVAKLSASNYEILGTEQIISSILEDKSSDLTKILSQFGVTSELFDEKLSNIQSRQAEYEGRQIIFTPNAFRVMNLALETAKELGSSVVLPEHMVLGLLKTKKGVAYDIFKALKVSDNDLAHGIIKPIEKQMPETLVILRLAKEEARRLGRNTVGTEMFLLGIIGQASGIGANVLSALEINIKDARTIIENMIGFGNEYFEKEIVFTKRAKKVLEIAWELAKKEKKSRIESSHMLQALTLVPDCLAMKALEQLGVDAVEIKQGIKKQTASE